MRYKYVYELPMQVLTHDIEKPIETFRYGNSLYNGIDTNNAIQMEPDGELPTDCHIEYDVNNATCLVYTNTEMKAKLLSRNKEIKSLSTDIKWQLEETRTKKEIEYELGGGLL